MNCTQCGALIIYSSVELDKTGFMCLRCFNRAIYCDGVAKIDADAFTNLPQIPNFADVDLDGTLRDQLEPPAWPDELPKDCKL